VKKNILITGASRGIGRAIAQRLGKSHNVAVFARDASALQSLQKEIPGCIVLPGDITREEDVKSSVESAQKAFGRIDVLVNNAGIGTFKRADQFSLEEFRAIYQVNVEGTFLFTKYVLPAMIQNKAGQIINISSVAGLNGFKGGSAYAASKFAVNGFTESLREDVKEFGIAVSAVCPGSVATDFGGGSAAALLAKDYAMTPDDVAATVEYLVNESETVNAKLIELKPRRRREFRGK
jgi:short-subunit dehydrogenase